MDVEINKNSFHHRGHGEDTELHRERLLNSVPSVVRIWLVILAQLKRTKPEIRVTYVAEPDSESQIR